MVERRPEKLGWLVKTLCKVFPYKEIGWESIDEVFFRWIVGHLFGYEVCIHRLDAPNWHPHCHDHPWDFWALVFNGYWERVDPGQKLKGRGYPANYVGDVYWRPAFSFLYRKAESRHNVATPIGKPNWSIVVMTAKRRSWGFKECRMTNHEVEIDGNLVPANTKDIYDM
jgi:hypothetical protein